MKIRLNEDYNDVRRDGEYAVVETNKYYDPEGLNIPGNKGKARFSGTYDECVDFVDRYVTSRENDNDVFITRKGDSVELYYRRAIEKEYLTIVKNKNVNFPKSKDELIIDLFSKDWKTSGLAACLLDGRGIPYDSPYMRVLKTKLQDEYKDRYEELTSNKIIKESINSKPYTIIYQEGMVGEAKAIFHGTYDQCESRIEFYLDEVSCYDPIVSRNGDAFKITFNKGGKNKPVFMVIEEDDI